MARAIARRGHEVVIMTTDRDAAPGESLTPGAMLHDDGVTIRVFAQGWPTRFATSWPLAAALDQEIATADVVHIHSLYLFHVWAAARACRRHRKPYLLRPHGTLDPFIRARRAGAKRALGWLFQDRVIRDAAALHWTAEEEGVLAGASALGARGVVVPNGLDLARYAQLPETGTFRVAHPEIGSRRIVLFLSRLNFKKGLDLLIPGFASATRTHHDLHLVIAGPDDGMEAQTRAWVAANGIADRVSLVGMLDHQQKLAAFADAAMFVLPSYSENFGIAVVEALACGVPVAISDKVNIWREISAARAGLVAPTTAESVAAQIIALASDPRAARAMGEAGRRLAQERWDWRAIAARLEAVYRAVAAGAAPPA
jgi:glycosyltransferase involved in cell wall biosynthesis